MPTKSFSETERGQILPLLAFGIIAILGMVALVADVGYWRYQQRMEQSAADSGAIAGAIAMYFPSAAPACPQATTPAEVTSAAQAATAAVGFTNGSNNTTISVTNNPPVPSRTGATAYPCNTAVQVIVKKTQPTFFSGIFGKTGSTVAARAVAALTPDLSICGWQIPVAGSFNDNIDGVGCGVEANGPTSANFSAETTSVSYYSTPAPGGVAASKLYHLTAPAVDPCFKIPGCAYLAKQPIPSATGAVDASGGTLTPPAEPGYLVVKNCCGATMKPGLYYIYGGISGSLSGTGVTLVNVDGGVDINGNSRSIDVTAPTYNSTTWPTGGVVYYQPSSNTSSSTYNGASATWNGLYYSPTGSVQMHGKDFTTAMLVIGTISVSGKTIVINPALGGFTAINTAQYPTAVRLSE